MSRTFEIIDARGATVATPTAEDVRFIRDGIDFQPNIFNGYHAVECGADNPPAVLNLPLGMTIREKLLSFSASPEGGRT